MFKSYYKKTKELFDKYERYLSPVAMAFGFIVDNFTLQRIDLWIENVIIITYFFIATSAIFYINLFNKKLYKHKFLVRLNFILPFVLQFAFGGLFSAFMVFYSRSSTLYVSWPFLLILFSLLIGNELFREKYQRLTFHIGVLYLALFAYSVFALPVLLGRIDIEIFLASGGLSLLLIAIIILMLNRLDHQTVKENKSHLLSSILLIYFSFNVLYFANLIPPIPLAMKAGGVYHSVNRLNGNYKLTYEKPEWYEFWRETASAYHHRQGERVYIFSSIFAPTKFKQKIYHQWYFHDGREWIKKDRLGFSITGGRDNGYRGYSYKSSVQAGKWRVDVITNRGQVLGRVKFLVEERAAGEKLELVEGVNKY
jgi:hypothetical protein